MTKQARLARGLTALTLCIASVVATSATASAATPATSSTAGATAAAPAKAKVNAELLDKKVKVNAKARVRGMLDLDASAADQRSLEPIVVQHLSAGVWVNVLTTSCRPNATFQLKVSFSIAANYSLRLYHPTTQVSSNVFVLAVLG